MSAGAGGGAMVRTILVVEDERDICTLVREILEEEGYAVAVASNGEDALKYMRSMGSAVPSMILLDLMLPVMDAFDFHAKLQEDPQWKEIPIVVFSANNRIAEHAASLAAVATIKKPARLEELLAAVERFAR